MKRIGLFGGSFNPVHLGHTALAAYVCEQGLVDEVWMMVSPQNPLKQNLELLDEQHRLAMMQLAVAPYPALKACDFEFHLPRPSYTYHTLQALRTAFPDNTFSLIIGEDNWENFHRWYRGEEILRETPVIVYPREEDKCSSAQSSELKVESLELKVEGNSVQRKEFRGKSSEEGNSVEPSAAPQLSIRKSHLSTFNSQLSILNSQFSILKNPPLFPYSSTEVRATLAEGKDVSTMLHPDVEAYIRRHGLYR